MSKEIPPDPKPFLLGLYLKEQKWTNINEPQCFKAENPNSTVEKNKPDVKHSTWNERIYTEREKKYIIKGLWTFFEYLDFIDMLSN